MLTSGADPKDRLILVVFQLGSQLDPGSIEQPTHLTQQAPSVLTLKQKLRVDQSIEREVRRAAGLHVARGRDAVGARREDPEGLQVPRAKQERILLQLARIASQLRLHLAHRVHRAPHEIAGELDRTGRRVRCEDLLAVGQRRVVAGHLQLGAPCERVRSCGSPANAERRRLGNRVHLGVSSHE